MVGYLQLSDGTRVPAEDGLLLGRAKSCGLHIEDSKVSRRHARLLVEGGVVEIEDLDSSNGTQLNGRPIKRRMLRDGDVLGIGGTRITYHEGDDEAGDEVEVEVESEDKVEAAVEGAVQAEVMADVEVLEFADDEIVQVKRQPEPGPEPRLEPKPAARPTAVSGRRELGAGLKIAGMAADRKGWIMGDDLRQMSGPMRLGLTILALALAVGAGYLAMQLVG